MPTGSQEEPGFRALRGLADTGTAHGRCADLRLLRQSPALPATLMLAACSPATSQDVLGSFFPSWLLCIAIGIAFTIGVRQTLMLIGVSDYVLMPVLTYFAVAAAASMFVWLVWFGH